MTREEIEKKIKTAEKDLKSLKSFLSKGNLYNSISTVNLISINPDYQEAIALCRKKHNLPAGKASYGSLNFIGKLKVVKMLYDAVKTTFNSLNVMLTKSEVKHD